ncbi:MAG: FixH family protein [Alphaproteobacteria bacterium]
MPLSRLPPLAKPLTGRVVLAALLGFFAIVAGVNAVFIFYALRSHPGLSERNAYQAGLAYNQVLADAEDQRRLGWQVALEDESATAGRLSLHLRDRDGNPLKTEAVTAHLRRPGRESADRQIALTAAGAGLWRAATASLAPGNWDVRVEIARPGASPYRVEWRIWIEREATP